MLYFSYLFVVLSFFSQSQKAQVSKITIKSEQGLTYPTKVQDTTLQESMKRGSALYADFCIQCHMADGTGVGGTFPPLAGADYLNENTVASIKAVKYGLQEKIVVNGKTYESAMPKPGLYDDEVADVMNYILNSWGNTRAEIITEEQVRTITNN
jgi:mono/diheme cytochrome c family protein